MTWRQTSDGRRVWTRTPGGFIDLDDAPADDEPMRPEPASAMVEWGAAIGELWQHRRRGGISDAEIDRRRARRGASAELRPISYNRKLSPVTLDRSVDGIPRPVAHPPFCSSTFAAIGPTCPDTCCFKGQGCMADAGFTRITSARLNAAAQGLGELQVLAEEARQIDLAFGGGRIPGDGAGGKRAIRLHVGGDVRSTGGARLLSGAIGRWYRRGGGSAWSFTHGWREVPREAWGGISVLASVEHPADLALALARGYAPAIVVAELLADGKRMRIAGSPVPVIPCPGETRGATCVGCRLCLDRPLAAMGVGIAFGVHGRDADAARAQLVRIRTPGATPR